VREPGGLAMSSRNQYLGSDERMRARAIHATLEWMRESVLAGGEARTIESEARARLEQAGLVPDYAVLRRADDLGPVDGVPAANLVALIAARAGGTRLIDNLVIVD
jgi:pantoate--beta-alanine ligase